MTLGTRRFGFSVGRSHENMRSSKHAGQSLRTLQGSVSLFCKTRPHERWALIITVVPHGAQRAERSSPACPTTADRNMQPSCGSRSLRAACANSITMQMQRSTCGIGLHTSPETEKAELMSGFQVHAWDLYQCIEVPNLRHELITESYGPRGLPTKTPGHAAAWPELINTFHGMARLVRGFASLNPELGSNRTQHDIVHDKDPKSRKRSKAKKPPSAKPWLPNMVGSWV